MADRHTDLLWMSTEIPDHKAFARFLVALAEDLRKNPESWGRADLENYLRAMAYWTMNNLEAVYRNIHGSGVPNPPTWRVFADILRAGGVMED